LHFSQSFFPLINRPTKITCQSATLIDNIFTNDMISNLVPSILCSDVSDHLPVFVTSSVKIRAVPEFGSESGLGRNPVIFPNPVRFQVSPGSPGI